MLRKVILIDEDRCDGCGDCVTACHEGAIAIIDGKARLVSDRYCDGLGDCLGECPQGAITLELREADDYDEVAVRARMAERAAAASPCSSGGCPSSAPRDLRPASGPSTVEGPLTTESSPAELRHWPVQLRLLHPAAECLAGCDLVLCADCVPFAYPDFHRDYLRDRSVAVGCPKLDDGTDMVDRLTAIFGHARPRSVTVARMIVPCCGGLAQAALLARERAGVDLPIEIHTIDPQGRLVEERRV